MKLLIIAMIVLSGCAAQQTTSTVDYMTPEEKAAWLKAYISGIEQPNNTDKILREIRNNQINSQINQLRILNAIKH